MGDEHEQSKALALPELTPATVGRWIAEADKLTDEQLSDAVMSTIRGTRLVNGLAVWTLRRRYHNDADYGRAIDKLAQKVEVTSATLRNWRLLAERTFDLTPAIAARATAPTEVAKSSRVKRASRANMVEVTAPERPEPARHRVVEGWKVCPQCGGEGRVPEQRRQPVPVAGGCTHPKAQQQRHTWGTVCGACGVKVR